MQQIKRALISTANKANLLDIANHLQNHNIEIIATGSTHEYLTNNGIKATRVADYTQFPEILSGRVKTLHPKIHGGILARRNIDKQECEQHQIDFIDLVIVNLYPFAETIQKEGVTEVEAIEQIDIGGPTMLRAAAKNFNDVTVIIHPKDYAAVINEITEHGHTTLGTRRHLAHKVFEHTAKYDLTIADYFSEQSNNDKSKITLSLSPLRTLRYGENPHQQAKLYTIKSQPNRLAQAQCLQGKPLSYNNLIDADAALRCVSGFTSTQSACAIIKHATPCGVALGDTLTRAYQKALTTDPTSAFGGIVAVNQTLDEDTAKLMLDQFIEVLIAPSITDEAKTLFSKKKNLRIIICDTHNTSEDHSITSIDGGILIQDPDTFYEDWDSFEQVTPGKLSSQQQQDLLFAWNVVRQVKSNAIVFAKDATTLGIGTGQTSRVFSSQIAALKAQQANLELQNSVMASDAFFPFADGIQTAIDHGVSAIIQPGGSKRDNEVIAAAKAANIIMVMTYTRHFKH